MLASPERSALSPPPDPIPAPTREPADPLHLLERRRSVAAGWLGEPGPTPAEVRRLLAVAARVPDHGALTPWRFILVEGQALLTARKMETLFGRPPLVAVVVSRPDSAARVPEWEQVLSAGAACMNLVTAAHALGYGANWLTGWAAYDPAAHAILGLREGEKVAGIIPIGTPSERPADRPRPDLSAVAMSWSDQPA